MSDADLLERLHLQIVDGEPVDWPAAERHPLTPDDLAQLEFLRLLEQVALAHRSFTLDQPAADAAEPGREAGELDDDTLRTWGRYRLEEKVGRGGFGSVYRAWDPQLEMPVAIKILHRRLGDDELSARLLNEGRALAQVKHANVVRVLNVEQNEGRLGLVMEFVRGETLDGRIATHGVLSDREAIVIVEDVCRALSAVHAKRLVHRDVKARNIMRERTGRIVLMDFGAGLSEGRRSDGTVVGTPFYMAPELLDGEPATACSDVYAVGVLLFHLVTGKYPYEAATVDDLRQAQARGAARSVLDLQPELPLPFARAVDRALSVDPRRRYRSASLLLQALSEARDETPQWRRRLRSAAIGITGVAVVATLGGMLSHAVFNKSLGLEAYADDAVIDWLVIGLRSMVTPVVLALMATAAVGLGAALRRLALSMSPRLRNADRRIVERCTELAQGLSLGDPGIASCWLILLSAAVATAAGVYWAPLVDAATADAGTASPERLAPLAPASLAYQAGYRWGLSGLAAANLVAFFALGRSSRRRDLRLPTWLPWAEIAFLVLLYGSMQIPYSLLHDADDFAPVTWSGERCYVLGERPRATLLFCPLLAPRRHVIAEPSSTLPPADPPRPSAVSVTDAEARLEEAKRNAFFLFGIPRN